MVMIMMRRLMRKKAMTNQRKKSKKNSFNGTTIVVTIRSMFQMAITATPRLMANTMPTDLMRMSNIMMAEWKGRR